MNGTLSVPVQSAGRRGERGCRDTDEYIGAGAGSHLCGTGQHPGYSGGSAGISDKQQKGGCYFPWRRARNFLWSMRIPVRLCIQGLLSRYNEQRNLSGSTEVTVEVLFTTAIYWGSPIPLKFVRLYMMQEHVNIITILQRTLAEPYAEELAQYLPFRQAVLRKNMAVSRDVTVAGTGMRPVQSMWQWRLITFSQTAVHYELWRCLYEY